MISDQSPHAVGELEEVYEWQNGAARKCLPLYSFYVFL